MNTKYIYAAVVSLMMGFIFTSCDDMLDIKPKNVVIMQTAEEFSSILDNKYELFYDPSYPWYSSFCSGADERSLTDAYPMVKGNFLGLTDIDRTNVTANGDLYVRCYSRISKYNIIIDNVMESKGTEQERRKALGEALILRAYNYFVLVNTYCKHYNKSTAEADGGLFLKDKFDVETLPKQESVAAIYRFIESDIDRAIQNLPDARGKNVNHPGLAFAYAVKAKVHLFKQEFEQAKEAAQKSLQYHSYVFDMVAWDSSPKPVPALAYANDENLYFGYGKSHISYALIAGPALISKYGNGDLRRMRFFWYVSPTATYVPGSIGFRSYVDTVSKTQYYTRQVKLNQGGIRVPEVMLMLAECYIREGKIADGMKLINDLRKKRILPASYADLNPAGKDEAFKMVLDERDREMFTTANNFYDIRRLEAEGIHQSVERVLSTGQKYTVKSDSKTFIIPFARDIVERNGVLKQNVE